MKIITLVKSALHTLFAGDQAAKDEIAKIEEGEYVIGVLRRPRNLGFHRKAFAMLQMAYDQWNPAEASIEGMPAKKSFDRFRKELTIQAGYYEVVLGLDGTARLEAQSLAFDRMGQKEFEEVYESIVQVLLAGVLAGITKEDAERIADAVANGGF